MSDYDGALAAIVIVVAIIGAVSAILAAWMVSGFICNTFGWRAYDSLAQLYTFMCMICLGGISVIRRG